MPEIETWGVLSGSDDSPQELMAIEHKQYLIFGVQFHPESFATEWSIQIIRNFIRCL